MQKKTSLDADMSSSDNESIKAKENAEEEHESDEESVKSESESIKSEPESENSDDKTSENDDVLAKNEGWADSIKKILGTSKPKNKKTLVLSRAKKHKEIKQTTIEQPSFEIVDEKPDIKPDIKEEETIKPDPDEQKNVRKRKLEVSSIRTKPNVLEKDRERALAKIATKGVVQLFNAVRNQQKSLEKQNEETLTESKKEKLLKSFDKRAFLDNLMGGSKSEQVDIVKPERAESGWKVLREDFMVDAKIVDWDRKIDD